MRTALLSVTPLTEAVVERPLKRQARNRRTQTPLARYRPFRVTRIVPLCRESNPASASGASGVRGRRAGATSASGTARPQRAASSRRSRASVGVVERLGLAARRAPAARSRDVGRRVGRVAPAPAAHGAHRRRPEAEVGPRAPVRAVVTRAVAGPGEVAHLVPAQALRLEAAARCGGSRRRARRRPGRERPMSKGAPAAPPIRPCRCRGRRPGRR